MALRIVLELPEHSRWCCDFPKRKFPPTPLHPVATLQYFNQAHREPARNNHLLNTVELRNVFIFAARLRNNAASVHCLCLLRTPPLALCSSFVSAI
jgi:hypothetical protein